MVIESVLVFSMLQELFPAMPFLLFDAKHCVAAELFASILMMFCRYSWDNVVNVGHLYKYGRGTFTEKTKICCSCCQKDEYCHI